LKRAALFPGDPNDNPRVLEFPDGIEARPHSFPQENQTVAEPTRGKNLIDGIAERTGGGGCVGMEIDRGMQSRLEKSRAPGIVDHRVAPSGIEDGESRTRGLLRGSMHDVDTL
jgi:hypothetical protein